MADAFLKPTRSSTHARKHARVIKCGCATARALSQVMNEMRGMRPLQSEAAFVNNYRLAFNIRGFPVHVRARQCMHVHVEELV